LIAAALISLTSCKWAEQCSPISLNRCLEDIQSAKWDAKHAAEDALNAQKKALEMEEYQAAYEAEQAAKPKPTRAQINACVEQARRLVSIEAAQACYGNSTCIADYKAMTYQQLQAQGETLESLFCNL